MKISFTPRAVGDLVDISHWYHLQGGRPLEERFSGALETGLAKLEADPLMGRLRRFRSPLLRGVRSWALPRPFDRYLVFYRSNGDGVVVVRVLHGMRDLPRVLERGGG